MQVLALWGFFAGLAVGMLLIDVLRFMVAPRDLSPGEASWWTLAWASLSALFAVAVFGVEGTSKGLEFVTGYALAWSLSVGNVFLFFIIFRYLSVPPSRQGRVLFLGILGAMVLRCLFISDAPTLLSSFSWLTYVFWGFLIWLGIQLLDPLDTHPGLRRNLRFFTHIIPIENRYEEEKIFVRREGEWVGTALLPVAVLMVAADAMFAVDAIAVSGVISSDPFIVYSSNLLAILGLRALYFLLAGILGLFRYLQAGLCVVLMYVGARMLLADFVEIPLGVSLGVVTTVLGTSIGASLLTGTGRKGAEPRRTRQANGDGQDDRHWAA